MQRAIAVVLALIAGLLVAAPALLGFAVERAYREVLREAAESADGRYEISGHLSRGWLASSATTVITLPSEIGAEPFSARLDHDLVHGPIPLGELLRQRSPLHFVFAVVDTRYDADPERLPRIHAALAARPLVRVRAWLGFDDSLRLLVDSPAFGLEDESLRSEGLRCDASFDAGSGELEARLQLGAVELREAAGQLQLAGVTASLQATPVEGAEAGESSARSRVVGESVIGAVAVSDSESRLQIADSRVSLEGEAIGVDLVAAEARLTLGDVELSGLGPPGSVRFALRGLRVDESTSRDAASGLSRFAGMVAFDEFELSARRYGPATGRIELRDFDTDAWRQLQEALAQLEEQAMQQEVHQQARTRLLMESLPELLGSSPELAIEDLELAAESGSLEASARLGVDASDPALLSNPLMLLILLQGEMRMVIAAGLLHELVDAYLASTLREDFAEGTEDQIMESAAFTREMLLSRAVETGTLVAEDGRYRLEAQLQQGVPSVNGAPVDARFLSEIVPTY